MADGRLRAIGVPPAGPGLRAALAQHAKNGAVLTSFDDAKLRAISQMLPEGREVDSVPFGKLLSRLLTMLGEQTGRLATKGQTEAAVGLVCKEISSDSPLAESSRFSGMASIVMDRLAELRDWGIEPLELISAAEDSSPGLAAKLRSIAEIDERLRAVMDDGNRRFSTDLVESCLNVPPIDSLPIKKLVVAVGGEERPAYEKLLKWILQFKVDVTVLLDCVPGSDALFANSHRTAARLGVKIEPFKSENPWYSALFTDGVTDDGPAAEVVSTADPLSEAEWAVRGCLQEIKDGRYPHNLCVFARDTETYAPLLLATADRLGLMFSASLVTPLLTNGFAILSLRTLEALAGDDVRTLAKIAASTYFDVGLEQRRELTQAVKEAYKARSEQWSQIAEWAEAQGDEFAWLRHVLAWRGEVSSARTTLSGWWHRLRSLIGGTNMIDIAATSDPRTWERDKRAQTVMQGSLSNYASVYDRTERPEIGLRAFVETARALWEEETIVVDGAPNGARLVSNTASLTDCDVLFVVGMLEGTLPRRRSEDPILFDDERRELSELVGRGVRLPDSHDKATAERDEFVRICSAAGRRIVFSYPETAGDRDNVPAFYLEELDRALGGKVARSLRPRSHIAPLIEDCVAPGDEVLRRALDGPRETTVPPQLTMDEAREAVRPFFEAGVSPEELETALTCPYESAFRYRLRLLAPARRRLMRSLRELPGLALIATQQDAESAQKMLEQQIDEHIQDIYADFEPWELSMLSAAAHRLAREWVDREFRARELWHEDGEKTFTNVSLDEHGLRNEFTIKGRKVRLDGKATALTMRRDYSVLRFYDSTTPRLLEGESGSDDDRFLFGLYLMSQFHLPQKNPAVEVDGMNGERILAGFERMLKVVEHDPTKGLRKVRVADATTTFFQDVKERMRSAIDVLEDAHMTATPGDHCEHCAYGELCRVSSVFGEVDAFEEDAS